MKASILFLALGLASVARAADVPAKVERPVKVGASHRVDVIAPGERVETIIDRMRAQRQATPPADARPGDRATSRTADPRLDARSGDQVRGPDRGTPPDAQRAPPGNPPGPPNAPPSAPEHRHR